MHTFLLIFGGNYNIRSGFENVGFGFELFFVVIVFPRSGLFENVRNIFIPLYMAGCYYSSKLRLSSKHPEHPTPFLFNLLVTIHSH